VNPRFRWIPRFAPAVLLLTLALTAFATAQFVDLRTGALRIQIDASANRLLPEDDPEREYYDFVRRLFGNDETLLVAVAAEDVFTRDMLERIARMTSRIEQIRGVRSVVSLSNALNIRGTAEGLDIGPFYDRVPEDAEGLARIRREALENPIYSGNLVAADGSATALLVYPDLDLTDSEFVDRGIDRQIQAIADEERGDAEVWLTGTPYIKAATQRQLMSDLARTLPLIFGVMALLLAISYRSVRGVVVPLLTIGVAMAWTLGVIAWLQRPLNMVTSLVPALLLTVGLSYAVHVVSEYYAVWREARPDQDKSDAVARALEGVALPVVLTGLTTAVGFASLMLSSIQAIREFGLFFVIGVVSTVIVSLTFTPALLRLLSRPRVRVSRQPVGPFDRFAEGMARFSARNRSWVFAGAGLVLVLSLVGASRMRIGTDFIRGFAEEHPVRVGYQAINEHLEGANPFYVVLSTDYSKAFEEPVNLHELESLQRWLAEHPQIGGTTSLVDYVKLINRGFHENDPESLAIPESRRLTSQLLFFGGNDELDRFVDSRRQIANVMVRSRVIDSDEVADLVREIEVRLAQLPEHLEARVTGNPVVLNGALDAIMRGQVWSIIGALGVIYLILVAMFVGDFRIGFFALIPNVLPVAAYFGALGFTGISLSPGTSLIAPMALGIAVDDTIHYIWRFNSEARRLADERAAAVSALRIVGRPVTYTSVTLVLGFLVLATSESRTAIEVGGMAAFALAFAWATDFLLTPAICSGLRIATLWDALSLDLGEDPQKSIPVLAGLSNAQARIVALMTTLVELPAGEKLSRLGEEGEEMYIVIDGKLRVWVEGQDGPNELDLPTRGEVFGEVGLFHKRRRSANADVVEDARLLRLTPEGLARLNRRYPKIAARVHHNLNEILAGRLAKLTARLR
jgi:predicted RND superfamily exporter protein